MDSVHIPNTLPDTDKKEAVGKTGSRKELFSTLGILIIAPIIAVLLTMFVFQSYQVDGPSMERTLYNSDRLIVTKTGKTWAKLTGRQYIPSRYSIIVFDHSGQSGYEVQKKQLIKRVIGLPGDRVVIKDGIVTIYNDQNPDGFYPDKQGPESATVNTTSGNIDQTVKAGEVFVLGDNRGNSLDSRTLGPVRSEDILGHLSVRIYPFSSIKKF
jgi:signal peptidase I